MYVVLPVFELIPKLTNQPSFDDPRIYLESLPRPGMKFQKITDTQWDVTRRHLPRPARTGRPRADDRKTLDAIMYVCVTGIRWIDHLPERYGSKSTAHRRLQDWQKAGVWKKILAAAVKAAHNNSNSKAQLEAISVDSSSVAAKKGATA